MLALLHGKLKHKGSICLRLQEAESGGVVGLVVMPEVERQNSLTVPCYHTVLARAMTSEVAPKILDRAYERSFPIPPLYITFWGSRCTITCMDGLAFATYSLGSHTTGMHKHRLRPQTLCLSDRSILYHNGCCNRLEIEHVSKTGRF